MRFDNRYCWVVHFDGKAIDRVRAYLDVKLQIICERELAICE
jgi:ketosteroid isomerase-like protein